MAAPVPVLPNRSVKLLLVRLMVLTPASIDAVGVKSAAQVLPPSVVAKLLSAPPCAVKSAAVRPVTASENTKDKAPVCPALNVDWLSAMLLTVGALLSMA